MWGELSYEFGASYLRASLMWGELSLGRGASCLWGELSLILSQPLVTQRDRQLKICKQRIEKFDR